METDEDDDPIDDVSHWVGQLPKQNTYIPERTAERDTGRRQQPDVQRKKPPVAEGR
jgi:hypothetical protein